MAAAPRPTANTPTPMSDSDRAELVYQVLGNEKFRSPRAMRDFSCTDLPRKRVRRKIGRPRCVIHGSSSSTEPRCGRRKNGVFGDSHPAFLSVYLEVRFPSCHLFSAPAPGAARRLRLELQAFRVLRKSAPLKKRNAAFVENFLRAFQLLRELQSIALTSAAPGSSAFKSSACSEKSFLVESFVLHFLIF